MRKIAVVLVGVLIVLAACYPSAEPVPQQTDVLRPLRELTAPEAAALVSLPWTIRSSLTADRQIGVTITDVHCFDVVGARLEHEKAALTVGVYGRRNGCRSVAVRALAVVQLPQPAAGVRIEHAAAGP